MAPKNSLIMSEPLQVVKETMGEQFQLWFGRVDSHPRRDVSDSPPARLVVAEDGSTGEVADAVRQYWALGQEIERVGGRSLCG